MIIEKQGNLLTSTANLICQQVNCQGVMGSGLAKEIREKYPQVYEDYMKTYNLATSNKLKLLGGITGTQITTEQKIIGIFGQDNYGRDKSVIYTDYAALKNGMQLVKDIAEQNNFSVAFPKNIGCGLANGDWSIVSKMIEEIFINIECEIWEYRGI